MKTVATRGYYSVPGVEGIYSGFSFKTPESTFNGFAVPWFKYEEAYRLMSAWNRSPDKEDWMFYIGNEFVLGGMYYPLEDIQTEEGLLSLFAIGSHEFLWWDESWTKAK